MTNNFKMDVLDAFVSKELGLVVTGTIAQGSIIAGVVLKALTKKKGNFEVTVKVITGPKMNVLDQADNSSGYIGLAIKDMKRADIQRGDLLLSIKK